MGLSDGAFKDANFDFKYNHIHDESLSSAEQQAQVEQVVEILKRHGIYNGHSYHEDKAIFGFANREQFETFNRVVEQEFGVKTSFPYVQTFDGYPPETQGQFNELAEVHLRLMGISDYKLVNDNGNTRIEFDHDRDRHAFHDLVQTGIFEDAIDHIQHHKSLLGRVIEAGVNMAMEMVR